jgi:hypothetical protein
MVASGLPTITVFSTPLSAIALRNFGTSERDWKCSCALIIEMSGLKATRCPLFLE